MKLRVNWNPNCLFQMQEAAKQINGGTHGLEKTCSSSTGNEGKS
jgi:hypothetical protein